MSSNQSRLDRTESQQYRNSGRSNRNYTGGGGSKASGTGSGVGATAAAPSSVNSNSSSTNNPALSSNRSGKKHNNVQGGQQPRGGAACGVALNSNFGTGQRPLQNGADLQQPSHGTSDPPVRNSAVNPAAAKPSDVASPKASRAPRAPPSNVSAANNDSKPPTTPVAPAKAPADASFSLQFGSISPSYMNGMQVPPRTTSAPPNLDEQKREQARHDSHRTQPTVHTTPAQSVPKQLPPKKDVGMIDQPVSADVQPILKPKREAQVTASPPVSQPQKQPVHSIPGMPMQMPYHQQQVPVQFVGPNPQIQAQAMSSSLPMSMQVPLQNHALPHQMFVPGLQPHPMQSQGLLHQGQNLSFTSHLGPQLPPQLGNVGMNMPPQFPQQQPAKYVPTRKAVKIMHPDTHEELRLDGSPGPRSHSNVPQSHPISSFSPAHTMNYYPTPGNYNAGPIFFPPTTSLPLNNSQPPTSQPPRHYSQVTVKPATGSNVEKDPASSLSSPRAAKVESVKVSRPSQKDSHTPTHSIQQQLKPDLGHASSSHVVKSPAASKLGKKKRKELLKKIDNNAPTSDLYLAYKGPEEKKEVATPAEVSDTISSSVDQVPSHAPSHSKASNKNAVQSKVEPEDWEDASEIPTPKLEASQSGNQLLGSGEDAIGVTKKYSRDFLLIFSEQCTALPEGFEFAPNIAEALMASNVNFSHESYSNTGRNFDRLNAASRLDRRGSGIVDDDKWNTFPGQLMSGRDMRVDNIHGPNAVGFRPNQSGNYGVLRNPRMQAPIQYPAGIFSGPIPNLGPQIVLPRNNADSDRWLHGTSFQKGLMPSPQTPLQMMHKTDNKYEVGKVSDEEQAKQRQLKAILNKLTPQNFEKLFEQVKQVNIDNVVTLTGVISQIFDKALMEPTFCETYANFCYHLSQELPDLSVDNQKITFKRLLVTKCQEEFERGEREQEEANKADDEGTVKQTEAEREEKRLKARRRMLGNIRLIGELYKKKMFTERIMHECIKKLLGQYQNPDEEDVEALCKLMSTIGEMIDHLKAKEHMDVYFDMMSKLSNNMKLSSRVRFMLKDAIDLRRNKWQQRRKVEPEDWEDAAEIPTPKLVASQSGNQLLGSGEDAIRVTKKYSRDFLLIFAEQCTTLPEGFEFAPNIAEALMASNVNFSHESYSNTGRNIDRPNAASRLDRRGSGIGDDVKWNKFPGQLMTGWDMRVDNTHGPNVLVGPHGEYIIDPARHFKGQWNYKGESAKITAFLKHLSAVSVPGGVDFQDRFKKSIFKDFVTAHKDRKFSGVLMRYLGFNMILPDRPDELHFRFENPGETFVFGRREFAMISGLKFGVIDEDVGSTSMCFGTGCYLEKYQNGAITIKHLERALGHPVGDGHHNGEVVYRLGLVYFIYGYLLGWNDNLGIPKHIFYLVEDLERVEDFAWGEYLWLITYEKIARLMVIVKRFSQQPEDRNNHKLAVEGWAPGFLYWAYELFPRLQQSNPPFCNRISHDAIPRMLRWDPANSTPCGPTMGNKVMPEVEMNKGMMAEHGEVVLLRRLGLSEEQISPPPHVFPKPPQKPPKELPPRPEALAARGKHKADNSSQIATTAGTSRSNVHRVDHNDTPSTHRHGSTFGRNVLRDEGLDIDGDEEDRDVLRDEGFNIDNEEQDHHDPVHAPMQHRTSVVDGGNVVRGAPVIDAVAKMIDAATKKIEEGIDATKKKIEEEFATIRSRLDAHDLLLKNQTAILNHFYIQERNKHGPSGDGSGPSGGGGNNTGTGAHQGSTQHGARNFTQSTSTPAPKSSQPHAPHPSYTTHTASCHSVPHTTESVGLTTPVPIRLAGEVASEGSSYLSLSSSDYLVTESEAELQAMGVVLPEGPSNIPSSSNRVSNVIGRKTNSKSE